MANSSIMVAAAAPSRVRWRPRQYVLAGMAAILAASTVVIVTSIILQPARINFSVTNARTSYSSRGLLFDFSLAVDNPSRRAVVRYSDVVVNLEIQRRRKQKRSVQAKVSVIMPFEQPPGNTTLPVQGVLETELSSLYDDDSPANVTSTIIVIALVRFRVGLAYTRLYDIRITCAPVDFFNATYYNPKVDCIP